MKKWFIFITVMFLFGFFIFFLPITTALVWYDEEQDEMIAYKLMEPGDTFQIIFVHSIHLTDVTEKYQLTANNDIMQYEMSFSQFGIGMPSEVKEHENIYYEDGFYHLTHMNNRFDTLRIRNGKTVSEHRFVWNDAHGNQRMVYMNDYMEPGALFTVKVEQLTLLELWKEVKIRE